MTIKKIKLDEYFNEMLNEIFLTHSQNIHVINEQHVYRGPLPTYAEIVFNLTRYLNSLNNYLTIYVFIPTVFTNKTGIVFNDKRFINFFKKAVTEVVYSDFLKVSVLVNYQN